MQTLSQKPRRLSHKLSALLSLLLWRNTQSHWASWLLIASAWCHNHKDSPLFFSERRTIKTSEPIGMRFVCFIALASVRPRGNNAPRGHETNSAWRKLWQSNSGHGCNSHQLHFVKKFAKADFFHKVKPAIAQMRFSKSFHTRTHLKKFGQSL